MKNSFIRISALLRLMLVVSAVVSINTSLAGDTVNGNACMAANLNQAFELRWDHARIENPASNPLSRFVTCTLGTGPQWIESPPDAIKLATANNGFVDVYFSEDAAADAEVSCIFREMSNIATTVVATDMVMETITADDSLPDTNNASFEVADGIDIGLVASLTVTCRLDPGTGINAITVSKTAGAA